MSATCLPTSCRSCARGLHAARRRSWLAQRGHRFERKFGVDDQRAVVRHEDAAVRPRIVRQRELEFVGALRQAVLRRWLPCGPGRRRRGAACCRARCAATSPVEARSVMFFCAQSMTASRACSCCRCSVVCLVGGLQRLAEVLRHARRAARSRSAATACASCCSQLPMRIEPRVELEQRAARRPDRLPARAGAAAATMMAPPRRAAMISAEGDEHAVSTWACF